MLCARILCPSFTHKSCARTSGPNLSSALGQERKLYCCQCSKLAKQYIALPAWSSKSDDGTVEFSLMTVSWLGLSCHDKLKGKRNIRPLVLETLAWQDLACVPYLGVKQCQGDSNRFVQIWYKLWDLLDHDFSLLIVKSLVLYDKSFHGVWRALISCHVSRCARGQESEMPLAVTWCAPKRSRKRRSEDVLETTGIPE